MKAAILKEFGQPLVLGEADKPSPESGDVIIKVEACGVCHSDLHLAEGDWPQLKNVIKTPLILGHEVAGTVVEKGSSVNHLSIGDRVGVPWIHWSCDDCEMCREGNENLCTGQKITGGTVNGGFAEFIRAPASHATRIPAGIPAEEAAPLFCAGVTVYRAIKKAGVKPGDRVAVFGVGGLGHLALQIAQAFGTEVIAVDVAEDKLEFARSLGADRTMNSTDPGMVKEMRALGRVHAAIVTSAAKAAYDRAFQCIRPTGTLAVVGLPAEPLTFPAITMVGLEARIIASAVGTRQDIVEVLEMAEAGKVRCQIETRELGQVNEVFEEMRGGKLTGRVVLKM